MNINVLLFTDFTALDVFGPVEVLCRLPEADIRYFSLEGGTVSNKQGIKIGTLKPEEKDLEDVWLIPGGFGTRKEVDNGPLISLISLIAEKSSYCLTVCTGSALLSKTGALNGRKAATNHRAFGWASSQNLSVNWDGVSRWVKDGKFYTSAGVSAGIDMALGFVSDLFGREFSEECAAAIEYERRD